MVVIAQALLTITIVPATTTVTTTIQAVRQAVPAVVAVALLLVAARLLEGFK